MDRPAFGWIDRDLERRAQGYAIAEVVPEHMGEVKERRLAWVAKTRGGEGPPHQGSHAFSCYAVLRGRGCVFVEATMESQNITVSLPKSVLVRVKVIAARRQTSVSSLLTQALERLVAREDAYARGRRHHLAWLDAPADLGTNGVIDVTRDELHER